MTTQKFIAPNMNLALQKVKQELGKDAVIVSHESFNGEVHVIATLAQESTLDILLSKGKPQNFVPPVQELAVIEPQQLTPQPQPVVVQNNNQALQDEVALIKRMITEFQAPMRQDGMFSHALQFFFHQKLQEMGFPSQFAKRILVDLPADDTFEQSIQHITSQLVANLQCRSIQPTAKYYSFIGPSGSGKTQLIVKIILHYLKNKTIENFACIFVNHQNVRVLEESKIYARIFNVPCYYVESEADLADAVEKTQQNEYVFIDFPAFDHKNASHNYYIPFIQQHQGLIHNTLVFAANIKNLKQYCALHEGLINEIAITKVDESPHLGEFVHHSLISKTPLGFMGVGQSYAALETATTALIEEYLKNDLCPNRDRLVMDKVFSV